MSGDWESNVAAEMIYTAQGWVEFEQITGFGCCDCGEPATSVTDAGMGPDGKPILWGILWAHCDDCAGYSAGFTGDMARPS